MKTRKIIFVGWIPFILGISMMIIDVNFKSIPILQTDVEIFLAIGLASSGLYIIGIAVVNEFINQKYKIEN